MPNVVSSWISKKITWKQQKWEKGKFAVDPKLSLDEFFVFLLYSTAVLWFPYVIIRELQRETILSHERKLGVNVSHARIVFLSYDHTKRL